MLTFAYFLCVGLLGVAGLLVIAARQNEPPPHWFRIDVEESPRPAPRSRRVQRPVVLRWVPPSAPHAQRPHVVPTVHRQPRFTLPLPTVDDAAHDRLTRRVAAVLGRGSTVE